MGRLWTSREQHGRTPVRWDDRCQPNSRRGRAPKPFGGEPTQFKEWIFAVDLSLRTGMIKDGQDQVDFASSFLAGTALLWFLSCLESRRTFANWAELKESLSATFGPLDEEEDDRLNLFALTKTGSLDDYIQDFSRLSLNVTALDKHSRALLFVRGLTDGLRADALREHPRTLSEALRAARTARLNAALTWPRRSIGSSQARSVEVRREHQNVTIPSSNFLQSFPVSLKEADPSHSLSENDTSVHGSFRNFTSYSRKQRIYRQEKRESAENKK